MSVTAAPVLPRTFRIEIAPRVESADARLVRLLADAGLEGVTFAAERRLFFLDAGLDRHTVEELAAALLADPVNEQALVAATAAELPQDEGHTVEVHLRPGVMDPVALSTVAELRDAGHAVTSVRTARKFVLRGSFSPAQLAEVARRVLANESIEELTLGTAGVRPPPQAPEFEFSLRVVPLRGLNDAGLQRMSRAAHLFLSLAEMRTIQQHFQSLKRDPTDLELETLAQTWSEHCVHKTLKSAVVYRGAPFPDDSAQPQPATVESRYGNLLKDTIARATAELRSAGRGPECLSVFVDNAGVIGFDDQFGVAFKVETHNRPSAIEPYGGAATGIGGCIRDVLGCGLGAKPIANTDVFCVAPSDWPQDGLPRGVLHPARVLRGVVRGVADYGNRMGIPTVNGAVYFDPRYLGNPLVFCGCLGLIPRDRIEKRAASGDRIVVIGGRTGRDGIHGATFSSAELTDKHADEFSSAVQIGNAITEKRVLDALLRARDHAAGCLYTAVTDCGAGGLSSAIGEMGAEIGASVDLEHVPLKYSGLRYDEIWISEAQERMVLSVPPERLATLLDVMAQEEVEASVIGSFGATSGGAPLLRVRYRGQVVGELDMHFLHEGLPRRELLAEWTPAAADVPSPVRPCAPQQPAACASWFAGLCRWLATPNIASKEWIIRSYDHEVQGGSVVKPLGGPGDGPLDAAVLRPRLHSPRGIAIGCGLAPHVPDPYWMACNAIDEALRNIVCVGGDPANAAILDNFCWGRCDDPHTMGALVRACQACYDTAVAYGTPFISGKDSLNNEYLLNESDLEPLLERLTSLAAGTHPPAAWTTDLPRILERVRRTRRLAIPHTLLISAIAIVPDVQRCVTSDLKLPDAALLLVGGLPRDGFSRSAAARIHAAVAQAIRSGDVSAAHDLGEGGWLVSLAEMALAGRRGVELACDPCDPGAHAELAAAYILETPQPDKLMKMLAQVQVEQRLLGRTSRAADFVYRDTGGPVAALADAWRGRQEGLTHRT